YTFTAELPVSSPSGFPQTLPGRYTLEMPRPTGSAHDAHGHGFGTLLVTPKGGLTFVGTLGDGQKVSQGGSLTRSGNWLLFAQVQRQTEHVIGTIGFDGTDNCGGSFR